MRRCKGIWPPSKPGRWENPLRDFCPLFPAPAVFPSFEPMPRPTRTLRWREPRGGRRFDKVTDMLASTPRDGGSFHNCNQMAHLIYHTTNCRRVFAFHHLLQAPESQAAHRGAHAPGAANRTAHPLQFNGSGLLFRHGRVSLLLAQLFDGFRTLLGHPDFVFQAQERVEGGFDDVMRIRGA